MKDRLFYVRIKSFDGYVPFNFGTPINAETRGKAISKRLKQIQEVAPDTKYTDLAARVG